MLRCEVCACLATLAEPQDTFSRSEFDKYANANMRLTFVNGLHRHLRMLDVMQTISDSSDPKDDKLLALTLAANVELIVASVQRLTQMRP